MNETKCHPEVKEQILTVVWKCGQRKVSLSHIRSAVSEGIALVVSL